MSTIPLASATSVRPVVTLTVAQLSMLVRFAILSELQCEAAAPYAGQQSMVPAMLSYASYGKVEGLECWWPFLGELARGWLLQRRTQ